MESISATEKQGMVSSFLEIAVGQSAETARQFLQAASWQLEEAIQLFYVGSESGGFPSSASNDGLENVGTEHLQQETGNSLLQQDIENEHQGQDVGNEEVRAPLPVKREVLYGDASLYRVSSIEYPSHEGNSAVALRNFAEELRRPGIWDSNQSTASSTNSSQDSLASLYRPPFALMHRGPFEQAKIEASLQDKWLLVNLQSTKEFSSHMLNRDTWANEAVAQTVRTNFIFWQAYDDTTEGRKVCNYYNLFSIPSVLVIDPVTGQKMRSWNGMIQPECLLEELLPFMDGGPKDHHVALPHKRPRESSQTSKHKISTEQGKKQGQAVAGDSCEKTFEEEDVEVLQALAASMAEKRNQGSPTTTGAGVTNTDNDVGVTKVKGEETCSSKRPIYPPLPEEPKCDRSLLCRVGLRLPNGQRLQRNFLRTDPIQLLWSFCCSQLEEGETRPFLLKQAIPGASKCLDYDSKLTFEESGLSNSMISVAWE